MHVFMHSVHFVEYNFLDDFYYLSFVKPELNNYQIHKNKSIQLMQKLKDQTFMKIDITIYLFEQFLKNPEYFFFNQTSKEARAIANKKASIHNVLNNKDPIIDSYLKNQMHWKYEPDKKIQLIFKPNEFKILRKLVVVLNKKKYLQMNGHKIGKLIINF